jgi:hypothetical protein
VGPTKIDKYLRRPVFGGQNYISADLWFDGGSTISEEIVATAIPHNARQKSEAGVNIDAVERPGLAQINSRIADRGIEITVYELKPGTDWKPLARDLINRIDTTWPQKITFRGPDG